MDLTAGSRTAVDLVSSATAAHLQVRTSDGKGIIYVDGVVKGEGAFAGDVAPGPHSVVVSREGYQRYEKSVTLAERQTWRRDGHAAAGRGRGRHGARGRARVEGIYGGFGLMGAFGIGGMGTELETNCANLGASSCDTPDALGGGGFGYVGYTWNPVGFELFLARLGRHGDAEGDLQRPAFELRRPLLPASPPRAPSRSTSFARGGMAQSARAPPSRIASAAAPSPAASASPTASSS